MPKLLKRLMQKLMRQLFPFSPSAIVRRNLIYQPRFQDIFEAYDNVDFVKAWEMFLVSAEKGDREAQNNVGVMYEADFEPDGIDDEAAENWYREAAEQNLADAQFNLASILAAELMNVDEPGLVSGPLEPFRPGPPTVEALENRHARFVEAYMWLLCANAQGHEIAAGSIGRIEQVMTVEQLEEAERLYHERRSGAAT